MGEHCGGHGPGGQKPDRPRPDALQRGGERKADGARDEAGRRAFGGGHAQRAELTGAAAAQKDDPGWAALLSGTVGTEDQPRSARPVWREIPEAGHSRGACSGAIAGERPARGRRLSRGHSAEYRRPYSCIVDGQAQCLALSLDAWQPAHAHAEYPGKHDLCAHEEV